MPDRKLSYSDFFEIATFLNDVCKGGYSEKDVHRLAGVYWDDYKAGSAECNLSTVADLLEEAEARDYLEKADIYISKIRRLENE